MINWNFDARLMVIVVTCVFCIVLVIMACVGCFIACKVNKIFGWLKVKFGLKKFLGDVRHVLWLFKRIVVNALNGDLNGSTEAWVLIKLHWNYTSKKIK